MGSVWYVSLGSPSGMTTDQIFQELKLYEIASSLADAVIDLAMLPRAPSWDNESRPSSILARLHSILSTFRGGGNKELAELLYKMMADAQARSGPALTPPIREPHPPVKSKMLPATTTSVSGGEDLAHKRATTAMEAAGPIADDISTLNNWSAATEAQLPAMQSVGQGHIQDSLSLEHHAQSGYNALQPLEDMLFPEFLESTISPQLESSQSVYDPSFGNLLPYSLPLEGARSTPLSFASLSPALPSGSVEMLINDFISQIPEGQFTPELNFSSNDFSDAVLSGEGFLLS